MNQVIDKQKENTQVQANMNVVHNILNGETVIGSFTQVEELAEAA